MQGITFNLQNPDSKPTANASVIYYDQPKASNLTFLLTQDLGIEQLSKGDTITIYFPDSLLQTISKDNVLSKGWDVKIEMPDSSNQNHYSITLIPTSTIDFGERELAISLHTLKGEKSTNGEVSLFITIGGRKVPIVDNTKKLFVTAYPDSPKELTESILVPSMLYNKAKSGIEDHPYLYLSTPDLHPPIANQLSLNLKYEPQAPMTEGWDINQKPFFKISSDYGSSANDLTDALKQGQDGYEPLTSAYNIKAKVEQNDQWALEKASDTTVWTIYPVPGNKNLFSAAHRNLNISFSHIISRLPKGDATLFIQWGNIPGYNDGWMARNIPKEKPTPKVLSFTAPGGSKSGSIPYSEGISLDWSVFGASQVQLRCDENPSLNKTYKVPATSVDPALVYCGGVRPKETEEQESCTSLSIEKIVPIDPVNNFYLQAVDNQGEPLGNEVGPVTIKLEKYPAPNFAGLISVKESIVPFSPPEKEVFWISPQKKKFTLGWNIADPNVIKRIDILGPEGTTLNHISDSSQNSAEVSFQKSGTYTILLRGKIESDVIRKAITINRLFEKELVLKTEIKAETSKDDLWKILIATTINFHFEAILKTRLIMNLLLKQNGTVALKLRPIFCAFDTNEVDDKRGFAPRVVEFNAPVNPITLLEAVDTTGFIWEINTETGNITLKMEEGVNKPYTWALNLNSKDGNHLTFTSTLGIDNGFLNNIGVTVKGTEWIIEKGEEVTLEMGTKGYVEKRKPAKVQFTPFTQTHLLIFDQMKVKLSQIAKT